MKLQGKKIEALPPFKYLEENCRVAFDVSTEDLFGRLKDEPKTAKDSLDGALSKAVTLYVKTRQEDNLAHFYSIANQILARARETGDHRKVSSTLKEIARLADMAGDKNKAYAYWCEEAAFSREVHGLISKSVEDLARSDIDKALQGTPPDTLFANIKDAMRQGKKSNIHHLLGVPMTFSKPAYNVEQHEFGISSDTPLGTQGVGDCVAIILRDPITHKTALAHVDYRIAPESINAMYERVYAGNTLEMRIQGARNTKFGAADEQEAHIDKGQKNIVKILEMFKDKDVDLISANIGQESDSAITIDPESGRISDLPPDLFHPNDFINNTRLQTAPELQEGIPLRLAFDLDKSPAKAPILLAPTEHANIDHYVDCREFGTLYESLQSMSPTMFGYSMFKAGPEMGNAMALVTAYCEAREALLKVFDAKVAALLAIKKGEAETARNLVTTIPIYIGAGAEIANKPLLDFIANDMFETTSRGVQIKIQALENYRLPPCELTSLSPQNAFAAYPDIDISSELFLGRKLPSASGGQSPLPPLSRDVQLGGKFP